MTHLCPHPQCARQVPNHMFACGPHWYALNRGIRNRIWAAYRSGDIDAHAEAMADAVQAYEDQVNGATP